MMTIREWMKANNKKAKDIEICIYDMYGMSPYDDENIKKYIDEPCEKIIFDGIDCIDCFFDDEVIDK